MTTTEDLIELEARVTRKWADMMRTRQSPFLPLRSAFDIQQWATQEPTPTDWPQFPREQWLTYLGKRTIALLLADRLMGIESLTDEQWITVCHLVLYGGRVMA